MATATAPRKKEAGMMDKTVALVVTFSGIGNSRKVPTSQVEVEADKEWIRVSKKLIEAEELEAVGKLDGEVRRYLDTRALPSLLKKGIYLVPLGFVEEINDKLTTYAATRKVLVEKLVEVYSRLVRDAKDRLRDLFNANDYVDTESLRDAFTLRWRYISFTTPASLQNVNSELFEKEQEKAEAQWSEAKEAIQQMLRASMADMVAHLVDKLSPKPDGKRKIFRDTAIGRLNEFLSTFDVRNVTDDIKLKLLVAKSKKLIAGVDPQMLRDDEALRDTVRKGFEEIKTAMDPLIVDRPVRQISFEE